MSFNLTLHMYVRVYVCVYYQVTQCEIFLSMLVKFLDSDKPMWQRTLAIEILHAFCNQPALLRSVSQSVSTHEYYYLHTVCVCVCVCVCVWSMCVCVVYVCVCVCVCVWSMPSQTCICIHFVCTYD